MTLEVAIVISLLIWSVYNLIKIYSLEDIVIKILQDALENAEKYEKLYAEIHRPAITRLKEQEVVEPKTGHWIESKYLDECFWVCSECNFQSEAIAAPKLYKYCPNCGSAMMERR